MHMTVSKKTHCAPGSTNLLRVFLPLPPCLRTFIVCRLAITSPTVLISLSVSLLLVREGGGKVGGSVGFVQRPIKNRRMKEVEGGGKDSFLGEMARGTKSIFPTICTVHEVLSSMYAHFPCVVGFFFFFYFHTTLGKSRCCPIPVGSWPWNEYCFKPWPFIGGWSVISLFFFSSLPPRWLCLLFSFSVSLYLASSFFFSSRVSRVISIEIVFFSSSFVYGF